MSLTLITCTGGRPEAFALCERWMAAQSYAGDVQWIVVDDCEPRTRVSMGQEIIRPDKAWAPGDITLARNIAQALGMVKYKKILFIEDDDYYGPGYLDEMSKALESHDIVGEGPARYYNVALRQFRQLGNLHHASLCQTGIRSALIPLLESVIAGSDGRGFIDLDLYRAVKQPFLMRTGHVVGIKGLPGRAGIGMGHRANPGWRRDDDMKELHSWIGDDAVYYRDFYKQAAA